MTPGIPGTWEVEAEGSPQNMFKASMVYIVRFKPARIT